MQYFAIQVWTGKEDEFLKLLTAGRQEEEELTTFIPKRAMPIRRRGKQIKEIRPIFPGYIFLAVDAEGIPPDNKWHIRHTSNFLRFLPENPNPVPVSERDKRILSHFISHGCVADTSKVTFDENDRIVVIEGPLKGLEGSIIRVDKRKKRAKIRLDFCENSFQIDLSFEILDRPEKGAEKADGKT